MLARPGDKILTDVGILVEAHLENAPGDLAMVRTMRKTVKKLFDAASDQRSRARTRLRCSSWPPLSKTGSRACPTTPSRNTRTTSWGSYEIWSVGSQSKPAWSRTQTPSRAQ